jgi:hypothetical protein
VAMRVCRVGGMLGNCQSPFRFSDEQQTISDGLVSLGTSTRIGGAHTHQSTARAPAKKAAVHDLKAARA